MRIDRLVAGRCGAFLVILIAGLPTMAQIPAIEQAVTTNFGTYEPPDLDVNPDAAWYSVDPGLLTVINSPTFDLPTEAEEMLHEQAFFISPGRDQLYAGCNFPGTAYKNFEDVYVEAQACGVPSFVTTDTLLHVFHRLFDHALKTTEEEYLIAETIELARNLIAGFEAIYDQTSNDDVRVAARIAAVHLAVGLQLLEPTADLGTWLEPELSNELLNVNNAAGPQVSPLFGSHVEDYSQYVPRGHYTRSESLERYFLAMSWYGRMPFALRNYPPLQPDQRPDLTAAALLLVRQLLVAEEGSAEIERWHMIYDPTEFFVGESDDLQYNHYAELAQSVYGVALDQLTPEQICHSTALQTFMDRAEAELPEPRIRGNAPTGLRLFGQRFVPDSWYLSEMVWDDVGTQNHPRLMPSVLDIMSVLGSSEAEELQRQTGAEDYFNYVEQLLMLRDDVRNGPPERWAATLYWNWIYSMAPLLGEWGEGFPPYMQSEAWPRRQLMSAAGTWTELRHDTILYVKQSNSSPWSSGPDEAPFTQGAVEPNPWLFARLGALAAYARAGLGDLSILDETVEEKFADLEATAFLLADAAERELERRPLTAEQHHLILTFGWWLGSLLNLDEFAGLADDDDDRSPVVADVHTDGSRGEVLEEGTGYAGRIFVVTDVEGRLVLTVGAVFLPFEFVHPMNDRLTDEAWWEMLAEGGLELPWWTHPTLTQTVVPAAEPQIGSGEEFGMVDVTVNLEAEEVSWGQDLVLHCNPSAIEVRVLVDGQSVAQISVPISEGSTVHVPTANLPLGDVTLVVLSHRYEFAVRGRIIEQVQAPRRGGGRVSP